MHQQAEPRITIVTVSLNNRAGLEKTIRSVISQRLVTIEYIVIDGGSTDGSRDLISSFSQQITAWISEPDHGPYDAMNKGIGLATGEWINFLNAGDVFYGSDSLSGICPYLVHEDVDAIYGDSLADYGDFRIYRKAGTFVDIWKGMAFSHQSLLMKTSLLKENRFDTRHPKIADYDLILRCLRDPAQVRYIPVPLVTCDAFGISGKGQANILRHYYQRAKQAKLLNLGRKMYYLQRLVFLACIDQAKVLLPDRFFRDLLKLFRRKIIT
jgi:glycosyltransferase involved in cell wall biosynthesis